MCMLRAVTQRGRSTDPLVGVRGRTPAARVGQCARERSLLVTSSTACCAPRVLYQALSVSCGLAARCADLGACGIVAPAAGCRRAEAGPVLGPDDEPRGAGAVTSAAKPRGAAADARHPFSMTGIRGAPLNARSCRRRRRGGRASCGDRLHRRDRSEDVEALLRQAPRRETSRAPSSSSAWHHSQVLGKTFRILRKRETQVGSSDLGTEARRGPIGLGCAIRLTGNTVWLEMHFGISEIPTGARPWSFAPAQRSFVTHSGFTTRREKRREALWLNQLIGGCQVTFAFSSGRAGAHWAAAA